MPVSAIVSEEELLLLIWKSTLLLAEFSFIILMLLVVARAFSNREQVKKKERKEYFSRYIYAALSSPVPLSRGSLPMLSSLEKQAVCDAAIDILRSIKGKDKTAVSNLLSTWGLTVYLINLCKKGTRGQRIQALTLISSFEDEETFRVLLEQTKSGETYVQLAALHGLAARGARNHIDEIIDNISSDQKTNYLLMADILGRFGESAVISLVHLVERSNSQELRIAALMALGNIGSIQAVDPLIGFLESKDVDIQAQAAAALGKIGDIRASAALIGKLADKDYAVRVQAAQALGTLKTPSAISALTERLYDDEWWVRFRSAEALHMQGNAGIAVLRSLSGEQSHAGIIASQVLAERSA